MYSTLSIQRLTRDRLLPRPADPWRPDVRPLALSGRLQSASIGPAGDGGLALRGLPRPGGGLLDVPLRRLPFHQSPGRWCFCCPCCGLLKGVLVDVLLVVDAPAPARAIGWACRVCAGLPASRAAPLTHTERLDNALDKAADLDRRPGEKAIHWERRARRAALAKAKAKAHAGTDSLRQALRG